ncbi:transcriptional activator protein acu-15 [Purpureocillium lilacinum]|uniref:Transcriptional activator protein acu-15 n=1 Tax=Purpureocillium lilacinum TaxID=33203 RepID=A0A179GSK9_PURLI|nr:transcriptional activator protein acu-15 [Purpureocillium lilacinum]OAQ80925.1 transcriptional activator protein acu-15 [Purpureocillium lilacinum]
MADEKEPLLLSDVDYPSHASSSSSSSTTSSTPTSTATSPPSSSSPPAWTAALVSSRDPSRRIPQAIAHRGYKAAYPENSMAAFRAAARVGAHAIETDVHLSADGVAVISHDPTLKRCFGIDKKISDCDWAYLSTLRMLRDPTQRMIRFSDFLAWIAAGPGQGHGHAGDGDEKESDDEAQTRAKLWILLDIKIDDDPRQLMRAIAAAISQVPPSAIPWENRLLLGCWNAALIEAASETLPAFTLAHIGYSLSYARHFLPVPGLSFNMAQAALLAPLRGRAFMRALRARGRSLFVWTVNTERGMEWCIRQNTSLPTPKKSQTQDQNAAANAATLLGPRLVDGVITDDPKLYLAVCRRFEDQLDGRTRPTRPATARETVRFVMHVIARQLFFKCMFVYRRFWQNKLDYMHERAPVDKRD